MQNYSIADAKTHLPRIIHEVQESKEGIQLTRHGKPVAVILSEEAYVSLRYTKPATTQAALLDFLANDAFKDVDVDTRVFDQDRNKHIGRTMAF